MIKCKRIRSDLVRKKWRELHTSIRDLSQASKREVEEERRPSKKKAPADVFFAHLQTCSRLIVFKVSDSHSRFGPSTTIRFEIDILFVTFGETVI